MSVLMTEVRRAMGDETKAQFGAVANVEAEFHGETLRVHTNEENPWDQMKVELHLKTNIYGDEVDGYYISYSSMWQSARAADTMSVLLGGVAAIAKKLEAMGVPVKS